MVRETEHPGADGRTALLLAPPSGAHHFHGLQKALAALGVRARLECLRPSAPLRVTARMAAECDVLVHADGVGARAAGIRAAADRAGKPVVLLMDGVLEFANTFLNPRGGDGFLRAAPADLVIAGGLHDRAILRALGNRAVAAGLPRLAAFSERLKSADLGDQPGELLVATANQPTMTLGGRERVLASLSRLKDAAARRSLAVRWRIARDFAALLGVEPDDLSLEISLARARAAITTASTLAIESMLARRPTAILHPHPWPLWLPSAWVWMGEPDGRDEADRARADAVGGLAGRANTAAGESVDVALVGRAPLRTERIDELLDSLLRPDAARLAQQEAALERCSRRDPVRRAAEAIASVARRGIERRPTPRAAVEPVPAGDALRVVSCIESHASSIGGVASWSARMERYFADHPGLGIDWRTLFIGATSPSAGERVELRPRAHVCVVDPTDSVPAQVGAIARAMGAVGAAVIIPNYGELSHAAAMHRRADGARVIAIAHTNDEVYGQLLSTYDRWDAAVGVSPVCAGWVREMARGRDVAEIPYGVPVPGARDRARDALAPIRLAYIGRVVEKQKRVSNLLIVLEELNALGVPFEFDLVGDGDALDEWQREAQRRSMPPGCVRIHGARSREWVRDFYRELDVSVITSDAEGTSVAMLESMAAGVLPCVTRVDESIDALLRDGENAIVVPVGDMKRMARRIAEFARDRDLLERCGGEARRTIERGGYTIAHCAEAYAALLRRVMTRANAGPLATDLGLRAPGTAHTSGAAAFEEELERHLREAGFERISRGKSSDELGGVREAVIVRATDEHPGRERIAEWRRRGIGVVVEPTLSDDPSEHITRAFDNLRLAGCSRIAVHADERVLPAVLEWLAERRREWLFGFTHHLAVPGSTLMGVPAFTVADAAWSDTRPDGVVCAGWPGYAATHPLRCSGARCSVVPDDAAIRAHIDAVLDRVADSIARGDRVVTTMQGLDSAAGVIDPAHLMIAPRPDVLVLRGEEIDFDIYASTRAWRDRGTAVHSLCWPDAELSSPERFADLIGALPAHQPYAIYGGGLHTERLLKNARPARLPVCILDDRAREGQRIQGIAVVRPDDPAIARIGAIILSSTRFETELWERTASARALGVRVLPLYATVEQLDSRRSCSAAKA